MDAIGRPITRPVNQWNTNADDDPANGPTGPAFAEGWDDWGPFYSQTYGAFFGVDGSTAEMCNDAACGGRLGSKREQYITFYSSADFWIDNRSALLHDQLEIFRRGVTGADRPNCCDDSLLANRGFTEDQHNWMVEYPEAFLIPFVGDNTANLSAHRDVQRSDAEANRMAQWLIDNGIEVRRTNQNVTWNGTTYPAGSYVVFMDQAFRGLAYTALAAGQDISERITQLYAPPGAWSHGSLWGADVVEIPADDPTFNPSTVPVDKVNGLLGGVRGGSADWYAVTVQGTAEVRAVLDLLRSGFDAEVAEEPFESASAGPMPAGSLIFPVDSVPLGALENAAERAGFFFERGLGPEPATTQLDEAPRVAVLVNTANPVESEQSWSLRQIFGPDVGFVSTVNGPNSLQNAASDQLAGFDVIYNTGVNYPASTAPTARSRLQAFFERGGGYIGTSQSANNFAFLNNAQPALLEGSLVQSTDGAGGGIARWSNEGNDGPLTGGYPFSDNLYLPSNVTWFSTPLPTGATVDGRYFSSTTDMFVAGLWRDRNQSAAGAPVIVHGTTALGSRYLALAANPFSRGDAEREWPLIGQAVLWSNLTDE